MNETTATRRALTATAAPHSGRCAVTARLSACPGMAGLLATRGKPGGGFGFLSNELQTLLVVDDEIMYPASNDAAEQWYPTDRKAFRRNFARRAGGRRVLR
jgi:hypothetical protein